MEVAKIDVDKLALTVINELQRYQKVTQNVVEEAVIQTAKETTKMLKENSPELTSDYKKSWGYKRDSELKGKYRYDMVVYNKAPEYRLTHLLEKGFQHRYGGRIAAQPHIAEAENYAMMMLQERIESGL